MSNVKTIKGVTQSGRIGTRFEHQFEIGYIVKDRNGKNGVIISDGVAGMPEVQWWDGRSNYSNPNEIELA